MLRDLEPHYRQGLFDENNAFEHLCDQLTCVQQGKTGRDQSQSARPRFAQYTFLHTAGISTASESTCVPYNQRSSWKKRILGCFH